VPKKGGLKKGSVLMISLWVLAILVVFALSLGQRSGINLKFARLQRDALKASYLAKAGVNRAIVELKNDATADYDCSTDNWANNEAAFKDILINAQENEFASVSYKAPDKEEPVYGIRDEESKININKIDDVVVQKEILELFLSDKIIPKLGPQEPQNLTNIVINWIDTDSDPIAGSNEDAEFKNTALKTPEELMLFLEYFYTNNKGMNKEQSQEDVEKIYNQIQGLATIYGQGKLNVNTASEDVLAILANAVAGTEAEKEVAPNLTDEIVTLRDTQENKSFQTLESIITADEDATELLNKLKDNIVLRSDNFRIESQGTVNNITKKITAVYDRSGEGKIVYWHEN